MAGRIRGEQIKDESVDSQDIASGSIKAGETSPEIISGESEISSVDTTNDRLLVWDATDSALKKVAPGNLGLGGGSVAGSDTQVQFNDGGSLAGATKLLYDKNNGRLKIGDANAPQNVLDVYGNISNNHVAVIQNDQSSGGHVLKLATDGNGSGSTILEMEDGDNDVVFKARADGRFGFGPDGVSSMGAGTFVVGIDNSSHTADIAISRRLQHLGDSNTYLDFPSADTFNLVAGGNSFLKYDSGNVLINNANADVDTKIMGDDGNVILHADAGTNRIGIGTTSPTQILTLNGTEPTILFQESGTDRAVIGVNSSDNILIENKTMNKHIVFKCNDQGVVREGLRLDGAVPEVVVNQQSESLINFRVESDNNTHMLFVTGSDKVGINRSSPTSTLHIEGSIALSVLSINAANDPGTTYAIAVTDCVILVNTRPTAQGGIDSAITLTLPDASDNPGMVLTIKDAAGYCDVNAITITVSAGDNLDGNPSTTSTSLPSPASFKKLISDGVNSWYEIGN